MDSANIILTSTGFIDGYEIVQYLKMINGEIAVSNGLFGAVTSGTFFTVDALAKARADALEALRAKAHKIEADAVVGVDIDISDLNGRGVIVSANGTAVKIKAKIKPEEAPKLNEPEKMDAEKQRILSEEFAVFSRYHEILAFYSDGMMNEEEKEALLESEKIKLEKLRQAYQQNKEAQTNFTAKEKEKADKLAVALETTKIKGWTCPQCGKLNPLYRVTCFDCGAKEK